MPPVIVSASIVPHNLASKLGILIDMTGQNIIKIGTLTRKFNRLAMNRQVAADVPYGRNPKQRLDIYRPKNNANDLPVVIFWHGGSWTSGYKESYPYLGAALADAGYVVVIPAYRLYPEVSFPAFIEDAAAATAWVSDHISEYGGDATHLNLVGHSAGAQIAALLTFDPTYLEATNVPASSIRSFTGISGPYDFYPRGQMVKILDAAPDRQGWRVARNIHRTSIPTLLLHGKLDMVVSPTNSIQLAADLKKRGGEVELKRYWRSEHIVIIIAFARSLHWLMPAYRDTVRFLKKYN